MDAEERTRLLQQIPVFALRQIVNDLFPGGAGENRLRARLTEVLGKKPRKVRSAVGRLTRDELTLFVNACPEIDDAAVQEAFERYRYGSNPSFYIYLFDPALLSGLQPRPFAEQFAQALEDDDEGDLLSDESLPRIRDITLLDVIPLPGAKELYEGTYRFLHRLDYIDADQNAVSVYETLYGFFWIGSAEGYVTIHARKPDVLRIVRHAIEESTGLQLTPLVISKQFKNALDFLQRDRLRSSRLHEPNPDAPRFRWLTVRDPQAYKKGYGELEKAYPELRSTRYRVDIGERDTTLTIHLYRGSMSLAGRLKASEFRTWAMKSLHEVKRVLLDLQGMPDQYVKALGLRKSPALAVYAAARQKDLVLSLFSDLLSLKQASLESRTLSADYLELCFKLSRAFMVQLPLLCQQEDVEDSRLACPMCDEQNLLVDRDDGRLHLSCGRTRQHWHSPLPFERELECEHKLTIDEEYLSRQLLLLPRGGLLSTINDLFNQHTPGSNYDIRREAFYIRGSMLFHHAGSYLELQVVDPRTRLTINQEIETNFGQVTGAQLRA